MSKHNTSHDYARMLREQAEYLEARPAFNLPSIDRTAWTFFSYYNKDEFLAAVRALGAGTKKFTDTEIQFSVERPFGLIRIDAPRDTVCRLVRPAEYDCEPFLSPAEEKELETA